MGKLPKIGHELSLNERAYLAIREAIINNRLQPNEVLTEEKLAGEMGISRTPIRSALEKLAYQRLVVMKKGRTAVVAQITESDVRKVFDVRLALEPATARTLAGANLAEKKLAPLKKIINEQKAAIRAGDYSLYIQKDFDFHVNLARLTGNELLCDIMVNIGSQVARFMILSTTLQRSSMPALQEHAAILEAIKNREVETAGELMKTHVQNVINRVLGFSFKEDKS